MSDSYRHQSTSNFKKLLDQEGVKNILIITIPIFLIFYMHIGLTRLWKNNTPNTKFDADEKLRSESTGLEWDDSTKIKKAILANKDDENQEEDLRKRNRQQKRQKQCQKQIAKVKTCLKTC